MADRDAITVLRDDHRLVDDLFRQIGDIPSDAPADSPEMKRRRALFERASEELSRHAVAEEELIYPLLRARVPDGDRLARHALDEHQEVKETLARLERMGRDDEAFEPAFRDLVRSVREHVGEEEAELFPLLTTCLDTDELATLGNALIAAKLLAPTRPHPNAPNTPPLNALVGLPTAVLDHARDALTGRGSEKRK